MSFSKKSVNFFKIGKGGNFAIKCISNDIVYQNDFFQFN